MTRAKVRADAWAEVIGWALEMGGHVRTGLEDNIRISKTRLAAGNVELVDQARDAILAAGRTVATQSEARALLGLASS